MIVLLMRMNDEDFREVAPTSAARDAQVTHRLWQCHNMRLPGCIGPLRAGDPDLTVPIGVTNPAPRNAERTMAWQRQACD